MFKVAGAAAEAGNDLVKVTELTQRAADNCRTIGFALSSCTVPQDGKPTFEIGDDEIEIGMVIQREPCVWRGKLKPVDDIVDELIDRLTIDMPVSKGDRISILVNGAGATPIEELYLIYRLANALLSEKGVGITCPMVGNYATSMEMAGASITIMKLDDELEGLLRAHADNPFWRNL